jgi:hypothetical protein
VGSRTRRKETDCLECLRITLAYAGCCVSAGPSSGGMRGDQRKGSRSVSGHITTKFRIISANQLVTCVPDQYTMCRFAHPGVPRYGGPAKRSTEWSVFLSRISSSLRTELSGRCQGASRPLSCSNDSRAGLAAGGFVHFPRSWACVWGFHAEPLGE